MNPPSGTVTFIFTDIEGSTKLAQEHPNEMSTLLARHNEILHQAIEAHNGYVFQIVGDSFSASFHSASDALNAALAAQRALQNEVWSPAPIKVRMGLHIGQAHLNEDKKYSGYATLAVTQRIMSAGHGGQVLLSGAMRDLIHNSLPENVELLDLGEKRLKDLLFPEHIYQLNIAGLKTDFPPLKTLHKFRTNLPALPTPFIGRKVELDELNKLITGSKNRLITIIGPGGMGKTRLGLAAAEKLLGTGQFSNGVFFVDLAPLNEARQIPLAIAETLEIQLGGEGGAEKQLLEFLRDKAMFFILDNFEHLLNGANLVSEILVVAPDVQVLVTSRQRLGLRGEQLFQIPGLEFPNWVTPENAAEYSAAQFFLTAVRRLQPDFSLTNDDLPHLTRLCQLVGGMPLALELAAGWIEILSVPEIATEVERSLDFLETDLQDVPDRQRSMQAVFSYTWEQLEIVEQEFLQKLSVFRGGFTREAAGQITDGAGNAAFTLKLLGRLVNKSLLQPNPSQGRYQIHELLRQYAWEKLDESGMLETNSRAHADYFLFFLQEREAEIKGGRKQKQALDEVEADLANIRIAWFWAVENGDIETIDKSLESLFWFFWLHSRQVDGISLFERTLNQIDNVSTSDLQRLKRRLAVRRLYLDRGANLIDPGEKLKEAQKILVEAQKDGNKDEIAFAFHMLGHAHIDYQGPTGFTKFTELEQNFTQSLALYRDLNDHFYESQVLDWLSATMFSAGRPEERMQIAKQRLEMAQKRGDELIVADVLAQIGVDHELAGHYEEADAIYKKAVPVFQEFGDRWHHTEYLLRLAGLAFLRGELENARSLTEEVQATVSQYNLNSVIPYVKEHMGIIHCAYEEYEKVVIFSPELAANFYPPAKFAWARGLVYAHCGLGDFQSAAKELNKALTIAKSVNAISWQLQSLPAAALIATHEGRLERAVELLALAHHHPAAATGWFVKFPLVTRLQEKLNSDLTQDAYNTAWERGETLDLMDTVNHLLKEV